MGMSVSFVGRSDELQRLHHKIQRTLQGEGGMVVLTGEAGIGKTRLALEAKAFAEQSGMMVLLGRAWDLYRALSYAPLVEAFGPYLRGLSVQKQQELVSDLPALQNLFEDLPFQELLSLGVAALEKTRLFESFCRLTERMLQHQPILLILDDIQWADDSTIELLHYLMRGLVGKPFLLLVTRRDGEQTHSDALSSMFSSMRRTGCATFIQLAPMNSGEVTELVEGMLGGPVSQETQALFVRRSHGTPLFIESLVLSLQGSEKIKQNEGIWCADKQASEHIPLNIRELVKGQLERCESPLRELLLIIAANGGSIEYTILESTSQLDGEVLEESLEQLLHGGWLRLEESGEELQISFHHPLVKQIVYESLSLLKRRRLHARLIEATKRHADTGVDRTALLALHYTKAGETVTATSALDAILSAVQKAQQSYAHSETVALLGSALVKVRTGERPALLPELLKQLGEALYLQGQLDAAVSSWSEEAKLHKQQGDTSKEIDSRRRLTLLQWERARLELSRQELQQVESLMGKAFTDPIEVSVQATKVLLLERAMELEALQPAIAHLRALAIHFDQPEAALRADLTELSLLFGQCAFQQADQHMKKVLSSVSPDQDPVLYLQAIHRSCLTMLALGKGDALEALATTGVQFARAVGVESMALKLQSSLTTRHFLTGHWSSARTTLKKVISRARQIGHYRELSMALVMQGIVHTYLLELDEARRIHKEILQINRHHSLYDKVQEFAELLRGFILLSDGKADEAIRCLEAFVREDSPYPLRASFPVVTLFLLARAYLAEKRFASALQIAELFAGQGGYPDALALYIQGLCEDKAGIPKLLEAQKRFDAQGVEQMSAHCALNIGQRSDESDQATTFLREALVKFQKLGIPHLVKEANSALQTHEVSVVRDAEESNSPDSASPQKSQHLRGELPEKLSKRELEIAHLIAEGMKNRAIAKKLFISENTVKTHLKRIYQRLGIRSRVALARWTLEQEDKGT